MKLYSILSKIGFLKNSYTYKFLFVTFLGIHIPLIGILFSTIYARDYVWYNSIIVLILIMTLVATAITLFILKKLIVPIEVASRALNEYRVNRIIPQLPVNFKDEAGLLLNNIQESIAENEIYKSDKEDLIYLLSHDLKNFAGNAQSLANLILEEKPSGSIQEYAGLMQQTTNQQFVFIETFIQLIKEEDEIVKKKMIGKIIEFDTILTQVSSEVKQKLETKNIQLISNVAVKEAKLKIDDDLLVRVLVNLIDNAIKFSHSNSVIKFSVELKNNQVIFLVSDSGIGFNHKYNQQLFDKFTNQGRLGTANESSTGIGLYLCKKIVEKHQGKLSAVSGGEDKGASFSVVFEKIN